MSNHTELILFFYPDNGDINILEDPCVIDFGKLIKEHGCSFSVKEVNYHIVCFTSNHLNINDLIDNFNAINWTCSNTCCLIYNEDDDVPYRMVRICKIGENYKEARPGMKDKIQYGEITDWDII